MIRMLRHLHRRELAFLGMIGLTALLIALHLGNSGLGRMEAPGGGWRVIDRAALEQRIERGDLRDREAEWFRPAAVGVPAGQDQTSGGRP